MLAQATFGVHNFDTSPFMFSAAPGSSGQVRLQLVCEHPGELHVVHVADQAAINIATSKVTKEEVEWLTLVGEAIKLCGGEVAPVDWGTERGATPSSASDLVRHPQEHLKSVWRPTSSAPLWVCKDNAAHLRSRSGGAAHSTTTSADSETATANV